MSLDLSLSQLKAQVDAKGKIEPRFETTVVDGDGEVIPEMKKALYLRRRGSNEASGDSAPIRRPWAGA